MKFSLTVLYIVVLIISSSANKNETFHNNFGSVLFTNFDITRQCWNQNDIALLTTHMMMRGTMPELDLKGHYDDQFILDIIEYFKLLLSVIRCQSTGRIKHILLLAYADNLGGYMKSVLLPIAKYAYYAGNVKYSNIIKLYQLYDEIKNFLKTNGLTWKPPIPHAGHYMVAKPINMNEPDRCDPCRTLAIQKKTVKGKQCLEIPMPFFDSRTHPAAIALPLKSFGLRNLESKMSAFVVVKFFVSAVKCIMQSNKDPESQELKNFHNRMYQFVTQKILPHLEEDKFYSAFGGILRITETLKLKGGLLQDMGVVEIMPETLEDSPPGVNPTDVYSRPDDFVDEFQPRKGTHTHKSESMWSSKWLLGIIIVLLIWFCVGLLFICIKVGRKRFTTFCGIGSKLKEPCTCTPKVNFASSKESAPSENKPQNIKSETVNYVFPFGNFNFDTATIKDTASKSASYKTSIKDRKSSTLRLGSRPSGKTEHSIEIEETTNIHDSPKLKIPYIFGYEFVSSENSSTAETSGEDEEDEVEETQIDMTNTSTIQ